MNKEINKAWVVTVNSLSTDSLAGGGSLRVISILSARKNSQYIRSYLKNISELYSLGMFEYLDSARYHDPSCFCDVHGYDIDLYATIGDRIFRAEKSDFVSVFLRDEKAWVSWKSPRVENWRNNKDTYKLEHSIVSESKVKEAVRANFDFYSLFTK